MNNRRHTDDCIPSLTATGKRDAVAILRRLRVLQLVDSIRFLTAVAMSWKKNRHFRASHPDYPVPPLNAAYDAYGYVDWEKYMMSGIAHAKYFATLINEHAKGSELSCLEWGCGPGRVLRHLGEFLRPSCQLYGTDINRTSIDWCKQNLRGIEFAQNSLLPPLPFADSRFDVVLCRSVFTHLSEPLQFAWRDELLRVTRSRGIVILTTQGDFHARLHLDAQETAAYAAGQIVTRQGVDEGRKWFSSFQSPQHIRQRLLADRDIIVHQAGPVGPFLEQDVWVVRAP